MSQFDVRVGGQFRITMRAQANFVEYVPLALILILLVEKESIGPRWLSIALGATLVIARL